MFSHFPTPSPLYSTYSTTTKFKGQSPKTNERLETKKKLIITITKTRVFENRNKQGASEIQQFIFVMKEKYQTSKMRHKRT